ncbi:aspartyl-tRNA(Asn)/glutamyl-tRNA(Gln) amidotransferase subunit A [Actinopolymorpha cephalotaxi]|uniref:Asp-tRNA(Asn)/Glu-tRNA(Gln) amidotransferase A subunit family amidase n=1 Tax=Actinopolymorpha cephalotaxi TaxID=504797 RepID=A0A1I2LLP5_9ACTN|nr:amidase [Actinopolymorpha cephalotaxi]NYH84912.1 Asp-tRNA(Asn)/Glu-tRNA(Gln) amidotransferase A subunit family amidase [Actinopolymorpha cephalotaxi]SFF77966.1 aspartyl-tRNA(Asn)/glutamyl-tRNA(Gln) amidotransferase subunit A [Actinopolymorpha cephalotaxi]
MANEPVDRRVDRRVFLARSAALAAAGTAGAMGAVALPSTAGAATTTATTAATALTSRPGRRDPDLDQPNAYVRPRPEAMADPTELTLAEAAWMIRERRLTPERLLEAYLARIGTYDATYQAFNVVLVGQAMAAARAAGRSRHLGPLHGIPLAIKDNYYTRGVHTTANSYLFEDFVPPYDATPVARLTGNGAIVLGKTQMGPLATTRATTPAGVVTTVNAWAPANPRVDPGGSSTGTATAVAGRMATAGTGTQTGGSITAPSNAQNLTGLKPTMGRVSLHGIIPLTYTRDHPGPLARDAKDAAIMLTAMAGEDPQDPRTQGLPPVPDLITAATPVRRAGKVSLRWQTRIGILPGFADGSSETAQARKAYLTKLASIPGARLVDVPFPDEWDLLTGNEFNNVRLPERSEPFMPYLRENLQGFGVSVLGWLQGALLGGNEFLTGQRAKLLLLERVLDQIFDHCDVVVQTGPVPFDILGLPEIAFPIGFTGAGLPIGTILGGLPYGEDRLVSVVAAYQAVTDWQWRRPADPPTTTADARRGETLAGRGVVRAGAADPARGRIGADEVAATMQ